MTPCWWSKELRLGELIFILGGIWGSHPDKGRLCENKKKTVLPPHLPPCPHKRPVLWGCVQSLSPREPSGVIPGPQNPMATPDAFPGFLLICVFFFPPPLANIDRVQGQRQVEGLTAESAWGEVLERGWGPPVSSRCLSLRAWLSYQGRRYFCHHCNLGWLRAGT